MATMLLKQTALNTAGQFGFVAVGGDRILRNVIGNSDAGQAVALGHTQALILNIVDMILMGQSRFNIGGWVLFEDDALYYSLLNYLFMNFDLDVQLASMIRDISPLNADMNKSLVLAVMAVINNFIRDWLELNYGQSNMYVNYLLHPVSATMGY